MQYILTVYLAIVTFIVWNKKKNRTSLNFIFCLFWTVICFFSLFRFFGLYKVPDKIYVYVSLGITSYLIGFETIRFFTVRKKVTVTIKQGFHLSIWFYFFLYLAVGITVWRIALMIPYILHGGVSYARAMLGSTDELNLPGKWNMLLGYFALPYLRASVIIFCVDMIYNRITGSYILKIMILTVLQFFAAGGRNVIVHTFIALAYLLFTNLKKINYKLRRKLYCIMVIIVVMVILATLERRVNVIENIYMYYCGGLVYFAQNLNTNYMFGIGYLYGINSFQGFIQPIFGILNLFGIEDPVYIQQATDFTMAVQTTVTSVSPQGRMNFFITCFGDFYRDGGVIGIIIESFIFGLICRYIEEKNISKCGSYLYLSEKIMLVQGILFTMSRFQFSNYGYAMTMVFIYLILRKRDKRNIDFCLYH